MQCMAQPGKLLTWIASNDGQSGQEAMVRSSSSPPTVREVPSLIRSTATAPSIFDLLIIA